MRQMWMRKVACTYVNNIDSSKSNGLATIHITLSCVVRTVTKMEKEKDVCSFYRGADFSYGTVV